MPNGRCHIRGFLRHLHVEMEEDVVKPLKSIFYKRYVDENFKRERNEGDTLFDALNSYHPNIKFTLDNLDTQIIKEKKPKFLSKSLCVQSTGP